MAHSNRKLAAEHPNAMMPTVARSPINGSQLTRHLMGIGALTQTVGAYDIGQILSQWINFVEASRLQNVLPAQAVDIHTASDTALVYQEYAKLRAALEMTITRSAESGLVGARLSHPTLATKQDLEEAGSFTPYRQYHQAHQQNMELKVRVMRSKVRDHVALAAPRLRQLVALDARYEAILLELEASRLSQVTTHLEKRFASLRFEHQQRVIDNQIIDSVALWLSPTGWLTTFHRELQLALLAELDLRLQPTLGLIEACTTEIKHTI